MECPAATRKSAETLMDYCAGKLGPEAAAALESHLEGCEACRGWIEAQRSALQAMETWEAPPVSPDFDRRLYQRIEQEEVPAWWAALVWPWRGVKLLRPAFSLALVSMVVLAALIMRSPNLPPPPQRAQLETLDADRLERTLDDLEMLRQLSFAPATDPQSM
jgi:anti-sigma factor RsiW